VVAFKNWAGEKDTTWSHWQRVGGAVVFLYGRPVAVGPWRSEGSKMILKREVIEVIEVTFK
jgi:hypothetical protein